MNSPVTQYLTLITLAGVLSLMLAAYSYIHRERFIYSYKFMALSIFSAIYIFGHAFELTSTDLETIRLWINIEYIGIALIPPIALILILQYTGLEKYLTIRTYTMLFAIPLLTVLLAWTNSSHHLLYQSIKLKTDGITVLADLKAGPYYLIVTCSTFGYLMFSIFILAWYWIKTKRIYWKNISVLMFAITLPLIVYFLYLLGYSPNGVDPVPLTMCLINAMFFWAIFRNNLFDLSPMARDRVFESMRDGVLVLNSQGKIVDFNRAAQKMIPTLEPASIGKKVQECWPDAEYTINENLKAIDWYDKDSGQHYRIDPSPIFDRQKQIVGRTIVFNDITEYKHLELRLKRLAYTDGLTQIFNRAYFLSKAEAALQEASKRKTSYALILFDIDHFKQINDQFGHAGGDAALLEVVRQCQKHLDPDTLFGRYGGEEFAICLPGKTIREASRIADKIRTSIASGRLEMPQGPLTLTASFGISERNDNIEKLDCLLQQADDALYASKDSGRNAIHIALYDGSTRFEKQHNI